MRVACSGTDNRSISFVGFECRSLRHNILAVSLTDVCPALNPALPSLSLFSPSSPSLISMIVQKCRAVVHSRASLSPFGLLFDRRGARREIRQSAAAPSALARNGSPLSLSLSSLCSEVDHAVSCKKGESVFCASNSLSSLSLDDRRLREFGVFADELKGEWFLKLDLSTRTGCLGFSSLPVKVHSLADQSSLVGSVEFSKSRKKW